MTSSGKVIFITYAMKQGPFPMPRLSENLPQLTLEATAFYCANDKRRAYVTCLGPVASMW